MPGGQFVALPEAAHSINWEQPEAFKRNVLKFVRGHWRHADCHPDYACSDWNTNTNAWLISGHRGRLMVPIPVFAERVRDNDPSC
jgi:hypothetical protein